MAPKEVSLGVPHGCILNLMTVEELKSGARELPEDQRFELLADLLGSLPAVLSDVDDGSEEAGRRLAEMRSDPSARMSWDEVKSKLGR
jgi:putative addiction module component (TIGR02574 family)